MRALSLAVMVAALLVARPARADRIDRRASELASGSYKTRVSAALYLAKQRDARALAALAGALAHDADASVRAVAAAALGELIELDTPSAARARARAALADAADGDSSARVRARARSSLRAVDALQPARASEVFVAIGTPRLSGRRTSAQVATLLQGDLQSALRRHAPGFAQATVSQGWPSRAELSRRNAMGVHVNAVVGAVQIESRGAGAVVRCEVTLTVNAWDGRDGEERLRAEETASASGRGSVSSATSRGAVARARRDCVTAVMDQVAAQQVVPFVRRLVDRRLAQSERGGQRMRRER